MTTKSADVAVGVVFKHRGANEIQEAQRALDGLKAHATAGGAAMEHAGHQAEAATGKVRHMGHAAHDAGKMFQQMADMMLATALIAGLKKGADTAIQFESAVADVAKVVDGGAQEAAHLRTEIEKLAQSLPVSQKGLADIAVAAGQLGVASAEIPEFIELTAKASTAFGMSADATGQAFGNLSSSYKLSVSGMRRMADEINLVGNTSATSEQHLIDFALRVGSLTQTAQMSRQVLLALGGALLPQVGNSAERAGTGINSMITKLMAVETDVKAKKTFKDLHIDAKAFGTMLRTDTLGALEMLKKKLDGLNTQDKTKAMLKIFDLTTQDEAALVLGSLEKARDLLKDLNDQKKVAGSVEREYAQRIKTTEAQLQLLKNALTQAALDVGDAFLPSIIEAAKSLTELTRTVAEFSKAHPELVRMVVLSVSGLVLFRGAVAGLHMLFPALTTALGSMVSGLATFKSAGAAAAGGLDIVGGAADRNKGKLSALERGARTLSGVLRALPGLMAAAAVGVPMMLDAKERAENITDTVEGKTKDIGKAQAALVELERKKAEVDKQLQEMKEGKRPERVEGQFLGLRQNEDNLYMNSNGAIGAPSRKLLEDLQKGLDTDIARAKARIGTLENLAKLEDKEKRAKEERAKKLAARGPGKGAVFGGFNFDKPAGTGTLPDDPDKEAERAGKRADQLLEAQQRTAKAHEQAKLEALKQALTIGESMVDESLARREITQEDAERKRLIMQKATANAEHAILQERLNRQSQELQTAENEAKQTGEKGHEAAMDAERLKQEILATKGQLAANEAQLAVLEGRVRSVDAQSAEKVAAARASLSADLAELQGKTLEAARIRQEEALRQFKASPEGQDATNLALYERAAALKALNDQLAVEEKRYNEQNETLRQEQDKLTKKHEDGKTTDLEYAQAQAEANARFRSELEQQIAAMEAIRDKLASPDMGVDTTALDLKLAGLRQNLHAVKTETDKLGEAINDGFAKGIDAGLDRLLENARDLKGALQAVLLEMVKAWQKLVLEELKQRALRALTGTTNGSGSGGAGGYISAGISAIGGWLGYADGGIVRGPGGPREDLIPAWLSNGEAVLNARAVALLGEDVIDELNRKARRYADGGVVGARSRALGPLVAAAPQVIVQNRIGDDELLAVMDTPKGRRFINNVVRTSD